ncbi:hypothetical protein [Rugamonas sp.]|uniref:hypothetical protein n=1 Tax=Rugamonas sp. TaxID=1926287 RepID=UPI0025D20FE3|nr:hypothetical protein [Rugamonas sp.]
MGLFTRRRRPATDTDGLGGHVVALRMADGDAAPAGAAVVIFNAAAYARRGAAGRIAVGEGETVFCFHPGPYSSDLTPFAAAPELGLRLRFLIDAADPRVTQQRFDLFLFSEAGPRLTVADFSAAIEAALQAELGQGSLDLPPCTSVEEWHAFRAGLNQLLYTRFGVTVDDCVPVDLGERVDFAQLLAARAVAVARPAPVMAAASAAPPPAPAARDAQPAVRAADARSLRRLFLELPALTSGLRLLVLPAGQPLFQLHQKLLQRLGLIALSASTMPSLEWSAPNQPSPLSQQERRAAGSALAVKSLDEAWGLLARLQLAVPLQLAELFDEADRIVSNLDDQLQRRRLADASLPMVDDDKPDDDKTVASTERKEPT